MQRYSSAIGLVAGAVIGGLIVGVFPAEPRWLWSMVGGITGGALGLAAAALSSLRWPWPLRLLAACALLVLGFGLLFLVVGGRWITDPRNIQISGP